MIPTSRQHTPTCSTHRVEVNCDRILQDPVLAYPNRGRVPSCNQGVQNGTLLTCRYAALSSRTCRPLRKMRVDRAERVGALLSEFPYRAGSCTIGHSALPRPTANPPVPNPGLAQATKYGKLIRPTSNPQRNPMVGSLGGIHEPHHPPCSLIRLSVGP